jgi:hypothetical protein
MKSPVATKVVKGKMVFLDALGEIMTGKSVTKLEWGDKKYFGFLKDGRLTLHKPDGKFYDWILSDGDLFGDDFILL